MKMPKIINKASFGLLRFKSTMKKHSPEILMGVGTVGIVTGTVLACKATIKAQDIIFDSQEDLGPEDDPKEIRKIKLETYCDVAKVYTPPVITIALSLGAMWGSNYIYRERCAKLAAAYTAVNSAFMQYRKAVREAFGADVDHELMTGAKMQSIEYVDENGKKHKEKRVVVDPDAMYSPYARFYDEACREWSKDPNTNLFVLNRLQAQWNDTLRSRCTKDHPIGWVTYNEVLESLGLPPSSIFANAGWVYNPERSDIDNKIDFGIYQAWKPRNVEFVNGYENVIILDFNVDGDISYILDQYMPGRKKLPINYKKTGQREIEYIGGGDE